MPETKRFDVTTIGSTLLRLSVPPGERLETAVSYSVRTAGTEGNTMVALSRMGFKTGWVSRLKDDVIGRRIAGEIHAHGVDTSRVIWTDRDRNEIFFVEYGASPRGIRVVYDRSGSAVSKIRFSDVDPIYLLDTRILHMTGILPALSTRCRQTAEAAMEAAKRAQVKISFDVNYRGKLWGKREAARTLGPIIKRCDILFLTREDAVDIFGLAGPPEKMLRSAYETYGPELCVMTLGNEGGMAFDGDRLYRSPAYDVQILDRLGAGDSFTAGFLCGYLEGSIQTGMDYASAMAALKLGIKGDYFISGRKEVLGLVKGAGRREVGR
jgi:2-dehydro-3-deoxygluconokinase